MSRLAISVYLFVLPLLAEATFSQWTESTVVYQIPGTDDALVRLSFRGSVVFPLASGKATGAFSDRSHGPSLDGASSSMINATSPSTTDGPVTSDGSQKPGSSTMPAPLLEMARTYPILDLRLTSTRGTGRLLTRKIGTSGWLDMPPPGLELALQLDLDRQTVGLAGESGFGPNLEVSKRSMRDRDAVGGIVEGIAQSLAAVTGTAVPALLRFGVITTPSLPWWHLTRPYLRFHRADRRNDTARTSVDFDTMSNTGGYDDHLRNPRAMHDRLFSLHGVLSQEMPCLDTIAAWGKLLPCGTQAGTASVLRPDVIVQTPLHSFELHMKIAPLHSYHALLEVSVDISVMQPNVDWMKVGAEIPLHDAFGEPSTRGRRDMELVESEPVELEAANLRKCTTVDRYTLLKRIFPGEMSNLSCPFVSGSRAAQFFYASTSSDPPLAVVVPTIDANIDTNKTISLSNSRGTTTTNSVDLKSCTEAPQHHSEGSSSGSAMEAAKSVGGSAWLSSFESRPADIWNIEDVDSRIHRQSPLDFMLQLRTRLVASVLPSNVPRELPRVAEEGPDDGSASSMLVHVFQPLPWELGVRWSTMKFELDNEVLVVNGKERSARVLWARLQPSVPRTWGASIEMLLRLPTPTFPLEGQKSKGNSVSESEPVDEIDSRDSFAFDSSSLNTTFDLYIECGLQKEVLSIFDVSPDASRGVDIPAGVISVIAWKDLDSLERIGLAGGRLFWDRKEAKALTYAAQRRSFPHLVNLPIADASMPFNVICFSSTVIALTFGAVIGALLKDVQHAESEDEKRRREAQNLAARLKAAFRRRLWRLALVLTISGLTALYLDRNLQQQVVAYIHDVESYLRFKMSSHDEI